jgi:hypothetical protein
MTGTENRHDDDGQVQLSARPNAEAASGLGVEVLILDSPGMAEPIVGETVLLDLADLLPDDAGEVVLFADDALPVNILADQPMTDAGIAEAHVTATGVDVTGLHFYSFEGGVTVYSPTDVLIVIDSGVT